MLSSKLALVTGAGSGIGRATCLAFAREKARVIAVDKDADSINRLKTSLGDGDHSAYQMDVTKSENVAHVANQVMLRYKEPPSILVNCAGITLDAFIAKMTEEQFDRVIDVNLKGTFLVLQIFSKLLIERKLPGSIINVGSIIGKLGNLGQANYAASKAGVELVTKTAAREFGRHGIRCNVVLPGIIETQMIETIPEKVITMFKNQISLGRLGKAEEVADVITFLGSDKSSYVNGASIEVTGGFT